MTYRTVRSGAAQSVFYKQDNNEFLHLLWGDVSGIFFQIEHSALSSLTASDLFTSFPMLKSQI